MMSDCVKYQGEFLSSDIDLISIRDDGSFLLMSVRVNDKVHQLQVRKEVLLQNSEKRIKCRDICAMLNNAVFYDK